VLEIETVTCCECGQTIGADKLRAIVRELSSLQDELERVSYRDDELAAACDGGSSVNVRLRHGA
jgi:hypothetical protein